MQELQAFYDVAFPLLTDGTEYLEDRRRSMASASEDKRLVWLFCSLVTVSFPVEVWRQPKVPDSGASSLDAVVEPAGPSDGVVAPGVRATGVNGGPAVIDIDRLATWMDDEGLGKGEPIEHRFIAGGSQNEIYEIRRGDVHGALRIPPPTAPESRDDGILREWRIIEALDGTDVPHTPAIAASTDKAVLGRTFYSWGSSTDGRRWASNGEGGRHRSTRDLDARKGLAYQLVEGIALLSKVDWQAKGLQDLGRPDGFHERQVDRWTSFLERIKGRELPGLDEASAWLRSHRPLDYIPGLMHGDYQFANVMYHDGAPAQLAAIVDWEMGTVGDPEARPRLGRAELARRHDGRSRRPSRATSTCTRMPSRDEVLAHYAEVSGRQVDDIDFYVILAKWKLAIVLEQGFQRAGDDEKLLAFGPVVLELMKGAADLAETTDYGS